MPGRTTNRTDAAIGDIASDNVSGAAEILRRAAAIFTLLRDELSQQAPPNIEQAQQSVREACVALVRAQSDMSSLLRLASAAFVAARAGTAGPEALKRAADAASRFVESATDSAHAAAMHAVNLIHDGSRLFTHSRSSTVLEALIEARCAGKQFEVFATESRPMFEGRKLASELSSKGINVTVIADAAAALFIARGDLIANMILVGADKVTPEHVVNKIGTSMIALAARERGLPVYAVSDTSKFIAADYLADGIRDQRDLRELWPDAPEGVAVANSYFEPAPLAYFTGIITELGVLSPAEASMLAGRACIDPMLVGELRSPRDEIR
jgi:ribose 1,5-bisphosphate isomerase